MTSPYPEIVQKISSEFLEILEKHYPGLTKKKFDNLGLPYTDGDPAQQRMEFCVYIELLKSGVFNATVSTTESSS